VLVEESVPVFSFTFGLPPCSQLKRLKAAGVMVIGTATCVREAVQLEAAGVDAIVAQGSEAGGHRGTWYSSGDFRSGCLLPLRELLPAVATAVRLPALAAGGIGDGRGIAEAMRAGASAAVVGTAYMACAEAATPPFHKAALLCDAVRRHGATAVTQVVSGKPGRVLLLPPGHGGATGVAGPLAFSPQGSAAPMAALPTQPIVELETAYGSSLPNHWFLLPACATGAAVKQWYKAQQRVRHNSEGSADSCGTGAVQCGEMGELEIEAAAMYPSLWAGTNFAACSSVGAGELTAKLAACAAAAASVRDNQPAAQQLLSRWIHTPQSGRL